MLAGLAAAGVLALRVYLPDLVYQRVRAAALSNGVELVHCEGFEFTREGLSVTHVTLKQCAFKSTLPMQPAGTLEQLDVDLKDEVPTRIVALGADVKLVGEAKILELYGELGSRGDTEIFAQRIRVSWVSSADAPPRLVINDLTRLAADEPWRGELLIGEDLGGRFSFGKELTLDLAQRGNAANTLHLSADLARFSATGNVDLAGLPVTALVGVLFHNVPAELLTVQLRGNARFDLPFGLNPKQPKGHFKFTFDGLTFPVPREVAGLVYDTSPEIEGDVTLNRTFSKFKVDNLSFVTGSLRMKGTANVERTGLDTHWRTTLRGPLPCEAIARAAAKIHLSGLPLGTELAQAAARISKQAIKGSVEIIVGLDAVSQDLAAAKLVKTIGVGCGLKPLPLVGAAADLLKELPTPQLGGSGLGGSGLGGSGLAGSVEELLKELPSLSNLPQLPKLPGLTKKKIDGEPEPAAPPK